MKSPANTKLQFAILAESSEHVDELTETPSMEWLFCKQTGEHSFDFYKHDALVSSINLERARFDLPNLLGMIVVGSCDALAAIEKDWKSALPAAGLVFRQVAHADDSAIRNAALECIAETLASQRRHNGRAALELAAYRREFERLQHNFARVEEYVGRQSFQRPTEIFEYPADSGLATETSGLPGRDNGSGLTACFLTQYLPVDSLGFSGLSIYVSAKPDPSAAPLRVKLKALETGQVLGDWSISGGEARVGWIELALNSAIDEPGLSLVMIVEWPRRPVGWALALGPPHPYGEFCACTETGENLGAPLGMRLFSSLPGIRVSATTTAIRPINAPHLSAEFIPYEVYQQATQISPPVCDNKATLVAFDQDLGCITVHPQKGTLTIARMQVVPPKHAWGLTAQIHLANERANSTQFGLITCPPRDENRELAGLDQAVSPSKAFSGWKMLSALEKKSISVLLPPTPEERLTIFLVTRQAPELGPDFAWARFCKLEFNVLPKSLMAKMQACESAPVQSEMTLTHREHAIEPAKE